MSVTANPLLDLRSNVGQVACTFRWDLVDVSGNVIGQIHPETGATINNDSGSEVKRAIQSLTLRESDSRHINLFRDLVRPWMVLEDGTQWPLGVFAFTVDDYTEGTIETSMGTTLLDLGFILTQQMQTSYGLNDGQSIGPAMETIADMYGIFNRDIHPTHERIGGGPVNWPMDTPGTTILKSLCERAGFHPPYFDNNGTLVCRPIDPIQPGVGHQYSRSDGRIEVGTLKNSTNLLTAPNAFKVVSSGTTTGETYAVAYIDPFLPHSKERRGYVITKTIRRQGLASVGACQQVANSYARQDASHFAKVSFTSVIDPRHDTFDIIDIDGVAYREISWSMELAPGGTHTHTLIAGQVQDDSYE